MCKIERLNVKSVDAGETALYEPSHLDLCCLQKLLLLPVAVEELNFLIAQTPTELHVQEREATLSK